MSLLRLPIPPPGHLGELGRNITTFDPSTTNYFSKSGCFYLQQLFFGTSILLTTRHNTLNTFIVQKYVDYGKAKPAKLYVKQYKPKLHILRKF